MQDVWKIITTERKSMRLNMASNLYLDVKGEVGIKGRKRNRWQRERSQRKRDKRVNRQNCRE